jgi:hypothetical protein
VALSWLKPTPWPNSCSAIMPTERSSIVAAEGLCADHSARASVFHTKSTSALTLASSFMVVASAPAASWSANQLSVSAWISLTSLPGPQLPSGRSGPRV